MSESIQNAPVEKTRRTGEDALYLLIHDLDRLARLAPMSDDWTPIVRKLDSRIERICLNISIHSADCGLIGRTRGTRVSHLNALTQDA